MRAFSGLTPPTTGFLLLPFSRTPPTHPFASSVPQSSAFQAAPNHPLWGPTLICMDTPNLGSDTLINIIPLITQQLAEPCTKIGPLFKVYRWSFDYFSRPLTFPLGPAVQDHPKRLSKQPEIRDPRFKVHEEGKLGFLLPFGLNHLDPEGQTKFSITASDASCPMPGLHG